MSSKNSLPFYPQRLLVEGIVILVGATLLLGVFLSFLLQGRAYFAEIQEGTKEKPVEIAPLKIDLGSSESKPYFPFPTLDREISVSFDPPRPQRVAKKGEQLVVRLHGSAQSKRVSLPCRIPLCYKEGSHISFTEEKSPFGIELIPTESGEIEAKVSIEDLPVQPVHFMITPEESRILSVEELPQESPFRLLGEGRWWGKDLFFEKYGAASQFAERIEVASLNGTQIFPLKLDEWIGWQGGAWKKITSLEEVENDPIAHIQSIQGKLLVLEGWDHSAHYRLALSQPPAESFKLKPEELFTAIRVRSDKQISCMLEKQCLILKGGDWVLKGDGKWRVLRKKEEREALLGGKLIGEIFVFDKIEMRSGQKMIRGHLFNFSRTQCVSLDLPTQSMKAIGKAQERKSRARSK